MRHTINRSFLVHRSQTWEIDLPDDVNPAEAIMLDLDAFDQHMCDFGSLVEEDDHAVDDRRLSLTLRDPESAKIIPMQRKKP